MVNLINSMTNDKLNQLNGNSVSTQELGKLAKLISEIKLIEGLQPIRLTNSRDIYVQQKPAQLLEARTSDNKAFSLILENKKLTLDTISQTGLELDTKKNALRLTFVETTKALTPPPKNSIDNKNSNLPSLERSNKFNTSLYKPYQNQVQPKENEASKPFLQAYSKQTSLPVILSSKIENVTVLAAINKTFATTVDEVKSNNSLRTEITNSKQTQNNNEAVLSYSKKLNPNAPQENPSISQAKLTPTNAQGVNKAPFNPQSNQNTPLSETKMLQPTDSTNVNPIQTESKKVNTGEQVTLKPFMSQSNNQIEGQRNNTSNLSSRVEKQINSSDNLALKAATPEKITAEVKNSPLSQGISAQINDKNPSTPAHYYKVNKEGTELLIASAHPLKIGSKLQVITDPQGEIQLLPTKKESNFDSLKSELARSLPQQISKVELLKLIQSLAPLQLDNSTSEEVQKRVQQLFSNIPNSQDLTSPSTLKQALANSGLFLENKLFNQSANITQDIKTNWLNIQAAMPQNKEEMDASHLLSKESAEQKTSQAISQALERITSSQIRNLLEPNKLEGMNLPLSIEIPIQDKGAISLFQLHIDQDKNQEESPKKNKKRKWLAKLLFDFPETGKFEARINIEEKKVAVIFVAEDKNTEQKIKQASSRLSKQLADKGLEVTKLDSFCNRLDKQDEQIKQHNLIDVRT